MASAPGEHRRLSNIRQSHPERRRNSVSTVPSSRHRKYSNVRRMLASSQRPQADAVAPKRYNYFDTAIRSTTRAVPFPGQYRDRARRLEQQTPAAADSHPGIHRAKAQIPPRSGVLSTRPARWMSPTAALLARVSATVAQTASAGKHIDRGSCGEAGCSGATSGDEKAPPAPRLDQRSAAVRQTRRRPQMEYAVPSRHIRNASTV